MLPEVASLDRSGSLFRLPPTLDVPVTERIRCLIDTAAMHRLGAISQLGMVGLVYPGAKHSRLEHSIGVFHNAVRLLAHFQNDEAFQSIASTRQCEAFLLASLVHDIGHWPFCHPVEDMQIPEIRPHESHAISWLSRSEVAHCIDRDWECTAEDVMRLIRGDPPMTDPPTTDKRRDAGWRFLASCLSGPIDVDKLDYLQRDSLHAGVPYGRHFDESRLINSMCVHPDRPQLAITDKGRTAAEMMVFARYVMFSEVYWHHAVRSATAMLQRGVFLLQNRLDLDSATRLTDAAWISTLRRAAAGSVAEPLVEGIFGSRRRMYKRVAEFSVGFGGEIHRRLSRRPYWWLVAAAENLALRLSNLTGKAIHAADVLIDAPPVKLEVDIDIDVVRAQGQVRALGDLSPVASDLAKRQFDATVKRVRIFVRPEIRDVLVNHLDSEQAVGDELIRVIDQTEQELV